MTVSRRVNDFIVYGCKSFDDKQKCTKMIQEVNPDTLIPDLIRTSEKLMLPVSKESIEQAIQVIEDELKPEKYSPDIAENMLKIALFNEKFNGK